MSLSSLSTSHSLLSALLLATLVRPFEHKRKWFTVETCRLCRVDCGCLFIYASKLRFSLVSSAAIVDVISLSQHWAQLWRRWKRETSVTLPLEDSYYRQSTSSTSLSCSIAHFYIFCAQEWWSECEIRACLHFSSHTKQNKISNFNIALCVCDLANFYWTLDAATRDTDSSSWKLRKSINYSLLSLSCHFLSLRR